MDFTQEFIDTNSLTTEQVAALTPYVADHIITLKGTWDKKANENAENILGGAVSHFQKETGSEVKREQGEKYGDYIKRATMSHFNAQQTVVDNLKADYELKLKEFKGGDALKSELDEIKGKYDEAQQKLANYDDLEERAGKYDEASQTLSNLKLQLAFGNIKPNFPDTVNQYEASAKWDAFKNEVLEKYNIEMDGSNPVAVDKENKHKIKKLEDLLKDSEDIQSLLKGVNQKGTGAEHGKDLIKYDTIPFEIPKEADNKAISKAIKDYLISKNVSPASQEYSKQFSELNKKIVEARRKAA